jgi:hypothetical protein
MSIADRRGAVPTHVFTAGTHAQMTLQQVYDLLPPAPSPETVRLSGLAADCWARRLAGVIHLYFDLTEASRHKLRAAAAAKGRDAAASSGQLSKTAPAPAPIPPASSRAGASCSGNGGGGGGVSAASKLRGAKAAGPGSLWRQKEVDRRKGERILSSDAVTRPTSVSVLRSAPSERARPAASSMQFAAAHCTLTTNASLGAGCLPCCPGTTAGCFERRDCAAILRRGQRSQRRRKARCRARRDPTSIRSERSTCERPNHGSGAGGCPCRRQGRPRRLRRRGFISIGPGHSSPVDAHASKRCRLDGRLCRSGHAWRGEQLEPLTCLPRHRWPLQRRRLVATRPATQQRPAGRQRRPVRPHYRHAGRTRGDAAARVCVG